MKKFKKHSPFPIPQSPFFRRGYTFVEMMVALGIFTIVLFISSSAFLSIVNADRKSRSTRIAMDNLNLALEDMSRKIKTGANYNCGGGNYHTMDCTSTPKTSFSFTDQDGNRVIYMRTQGPWPIPLGCGDNVLYAGTRGCILRSDDYGATFMLVTSPEIDIKELKFFVSGSAPLSFVPSDTKQPTVIISIQGLVGSVTARIQATVTQRVYDNY